MIIYDRDNDKTYEEKQYGEKKLKFLYNTIIGRMLLRIIVSKLYSRMSAIYDNNKLSARKIKHFVDEYNIDLNDYKNNKYKSFNDFFIRKIKQSKRIADTEDNHLISVADAKLSVYKIDDHLSIKIKNSIYTVDELIHNSDIASIYKNGYCLVFRLTVDDYHRYIYLDDGHLLDTMKINGVLHTVTPIATKKYKVYCENYREWSLLSTNNFNEVLQIEVGAILVGKINNSNNLIFKRGEEKGYFELGGSTIILLFKENVINLDKDILDCSKRGIEVKIRLGEKIGVKYDR
jgi:phosphatidylserine decarboxylase